MGTVRKLLADERGLATIEYGLLASFIALGLVTSIGELGNGVAGTFDNVHSEWTGTSVGSAPGPGAAGGSGNGKGKDKDKSKGKGQGKP